MKKDILLVRTSTDRQEIETQKAELTAYARQFTTKNELLIIGEAGASAIKEDEQFKFNLNQVFETIEKGGVECVYVWEISRIGRREETLFAFKNFLISRGVNLRVKNPTLQLLNDDGSVNSGCELAFSLFATMAKQEMQNKRERFKRGKERNKREGKYIGGVVLYGYRVIKEGEDKGKFEINEAEARVVRENFNEYITGTKGIVSLQKERGVAVGKMLKNRHYYGDNNYPPIISKETFELAEQKRHAWRNQPRERTTRHDWVDYCHGLVACTPFPDKPTETRQLSIMRAKNQYANQEFHLWLNINMLDSLAVNVLQEVLNNCDFDEFRKDVQKRKIQITAKIDSLKTEIKQLDAKLDKLEEDYYVHGRVKHFDKYKSMIDNEILVKQKDMNNLEIEKDNLEKNEFSTPNLYEMNDLQRKEMCQKYIKKIIYHPTEGEIKHLEFVFKGLPYNGALTMYIPRKYKYFFDFEPFQWRDIPRIKKPYVTVH